MKIQLWLLKDYGYVCLFHSTKHNRIQTWTEEKNLVKIQIQFHKNFDTIVTITYTTDCWCNLCCKIHLILDKIKNYFRAFPWNLSHFYIYDETKTRLCKNNFVGLFESVIVKKQKEFKFLVFFLWIIWVKIGTVLLTFHISFRSTTPQPGFKQKSSQTFKTVSFLHEI